MLQKIVEYHCAMWSIIVPGGVSLCQVEYHCARWSIIVTGGASLKVRTNKVMCTAVPPTKNNQS